MLPGARAIANSSFGLFSRSSSLRIRKFVVVACVFLSPIALMLCATSCITVSPNLSAFWLKLPLELKNPPPSYLHSRVQACHEENVHAVAFLLPQILPIVRHLNVMTFLEQRRVIFRKFHLIRLNRVLWGTSHRRRPGRVAGVRGRDVLLAL